MKQTVLIDVSMHNDKCQRKAMKIAAGFTGVDSASIKGDDKNQIEVVGDRLNIIQLTTLLRKKMGRADLVSVSPVKDEKKEETEQPIFWSYQSGVPPYQLLEVYHPAGYNNDAFCSIM